MHGVDEGAQRRSPFLVGVPVVRATIAQAGEDAVVEVGEEAALRIVSLLPLWMQRRGDHGEASSFPFEALAQGRERVETVPVECFGLAVEQGTAVVGDQWTVAVAIEHQRVPFAAAGALILDRQGVAYQRAR